MSDKSFEEWWKAGTSVEVPLYGEANAKKAWDYQQERINELKTEYEAYKQITTKQISELELGSRILHLHDFKNQICEIVDDLDPDNRLDAFEDVEECVDVFRALWSTD